MTPDQIFKDIGIDPIKAVEFMDYLDISPIDFSNHRNYAKFEYVLDYLKGFSSDTQRFLIKKVTHNKTANKLNCMFEYCNLLKEKDSYSRELDSVIKDKSPDKNIGRDLHIKSLEEKINVLNNELEIYHK